MSLCKKLNAKNFSSIANSKYLAVGLIVKNTPVRRQKGALAVEYGLILAIVITIIILIATAISPELEAFFYDVGKYISNWLN